MTPRLDDLARVAVERGASPGAVVGVARREEGIWSHALGAAGSTGLAETPVTPETIFDLASITKSFTAIVAARWDAAHTADAATGPGGSARPLELQLGALLPELGDTPSGSLPLRAFLSHRAGLHAHLPLYEPLEHGRPVDPDACLRRAAEARRPGCEGKPAPEGFPALYSDLGFLLAGRALERAHGVPLYSLVQREIRAPLGCQVESARALRDRLSPEELRRRVAPTEVVPFRGGLVHAQVHDENAWALGGLELCGHAGLFGAASDLLLFGAVLLDVLAGRREHWLPRELLEELLRPSAGTTLRLGFDGKSAQGSSAGERLGARSFGHLGFTGVAFWMDPEAQRVAVLLTNRVCPSRENQKIREVRPQVFDALLQASESTGPWPPLRLLST